MHLNRKRLQWSYVMGVGGAIAGAVTALFGPHWTDRETLLLAVTIGCLCVSLAGWVVRYLEARCPHCGVYLRTIPNPWSRYGARYCPRCGGRITYENKESGNQT